MIIAGNRSEFDTGVDEEVNKSRLHLGLARLEVITPDESAMAFGKFNDTRDKGVLGRAVYKWNTLLNTSNGEDG